MTTDIAIQWKAVSVSFAVTMPRLHFHFARLNLKISQFPYWQFFAGLLRCNFYLSSTVSIFMWFFFNLEKAEPNSWLSIDSDSVFCARQFLHHFNHNSCRKPETADKHFKLIYHIQLQFTVFEFFKSFFLLLSERWNQIIMMPNDIS